MLSGTLVLAGCTSSESQVQKSGTTKISATSTTTSSSAPCGVNVETPTAGIIGLSDLGGKGTQSRRTLSFASSSGCSSSHVDLSPDMCRTFPSYASDQSIPDILHNLGVMNWTSTTLQPTNAGTVREDVLTFTASSTKSAVTKIVDFETTCGKTVVVTSEGAAAQLIRKGADGAIGAVDVANTSIIFLTTHSLPQDQTLKLLNTARTKVAK